jgi:hypothetical protein
MTKEMVVKKEEFTVEGRKVPLTEIREKTFLTTHPTAEISRTRITLI